MTTFPAVGTAGPGPAGAGQRSAPGQPQDPGAAAGPALLLEVPVNAISPNPAQPRQVFDEDDLAELAASIREVGVLQPVVVRPSAQSGRYELVMGERRWRAAALAGLDSVPAVCRSTGDGDLLLQALVENLQRASLNPLEEAAAYAQMIDECELTHADVATLVGKSRSHVSHHLALLRLPPPVQRRIAAGVLMPGHARALVALPDPAVAELLAERIVAEGLSVRTVEELVATGNLPGAEAVDGRAEAMAARRRRPRAAGEDLDQLAVELSDMLETRVRVQAGRHRGRIVVEYADAADLERLRSLLRRAAS